MVPEDGRTQHRVARGMDGRRQQELGNYGYAGEALKGKQSGMFDLLNMDYLYDSGAGVVGDPDRCIEICKRYEAVGCELLFCLLNPYKIPHEEVMHSIELLGKHVIPEFAKLSATSPNAPGRRGGRRSTRYLRRMDDEYRTLLLDAYKGELLGEALFAAFAARESGDHAEKLRVLQRIEGTTASQLRPGDRGGDRRDRRRRGGHRGRRAPRSAQPTSSGMRS